MSFIRASGLGPLTASNTATIVDPATPASGVATLGPLVGFAPVTASSQTALEFIGIPTWARRVTLAIHGISTNSTGFHQVQLGSSAGYGSTTYTTEFAGGTVTTGLKLNTGGASSTYSTVIQWVCVSASSNIWAAQGIVADTTAASGVFNTSGSASLTATLDRIRVYTSNGTDTFDAGTVGCYYE